MGGHSIVLDGLRLPDHEVRPDSFGPSARADERFTAATSTRAVALSNRVCIRHLLRIDLLPSGDPYLPDARAEGAAGPVTADGASFLDIELCLLWPGSQGFLRSNIGMGRVQLKCPSAIVAMSALHRGRRPRQT